MKLQKLFLGAAFALSGCFIACGPSRHPTDAELLERFRNHRAELEQLVRIFESDKGLGRVGPDFTRPENPEEIGVSAERIGEYRRLCAAVGAESCIEGYEEKNPIWIHISAMGLSISGSSKGFLYSNDPPFDVVADLDRVKAEKSGTWIRHIEGPWYLYYDYED